MVKYQSQKYTHISIYLYLHYLSHAVTIWKTKLASDLANRNQFLDSSKSLLETNALPEMLTHISMRFDYIPPPSYSWIIKFSY